MTTLVGRRARLIGPRELRFEPLSIDTADAPVDHVCAKTEYSAVSIGTERAAFVGMPPLRPGVVYPRLLGYCNAARVMSVGSNVLDVVVGDRVLTHQSHQSAFCCPATDVLAKLPPELASRTACLTYLAHIGLTALQRSGLRAGETVVVQGLGPIGLATVAVARALGADVVAVGNADERLAKATELGAACVFRADAPDLLSRLGRIMRGADGADIVVSTVTSWEAWRDSLKMVLSFGRIAVLGFPGRGELAPTVNPFDPQLFYMKQVSVISTGLASGTGAWGDGDTMTNLKSNMRMLLGFVTDGRLPLDRLISHEFRWSELAQVYNLAESGDKSLIGAVLNWNDDP